MWSSSRQRLADHHQAYGRGQRLDEACCRAAASSAQQGKPAAASSPEDYPTLVFQSQEGGPCQAFPEQIAHGHSKCHQLFAYDSDIALTVGICHSKV